MGCCGCKETETSPPEPRSGLPVTPTELEKLRFDYAWKWFNFHAEQRTKMFNFMLLGMGIFATALVTAIDKKMRLEAALLSTAAVGVALVFVLIDRRNKQLYSVAMDVLIDAEKTVVFGDGITFVPDQNGGTDAKTFGISRRVAIEDGKPPATLAQLGLGVLEGRHRYMMPLVAWGFAALFALAALRGWLTYFGWSLYWPLTLGGVLLFFGSAIALNLRTGPLVRLLGALGLVVGLGSLVAAQLVPELKTPLKPPAEADFVFETALNGQLGVRIRRSTDDAGPYEFGVLASARIGPFASGEALLDCEAAQQREALAGIRAALGSGGSRQRTMLLLVGATDRAPLSPKLRQRYESNAGLARARVGAVEQCLNPAPAEGAGPRQDAPETLRLISGPAFTPEARATDALTDPEMASDREVKVFVIGLAARKS